MKSRNLSFLGIVTAAGRDPTAITWPTVGGRAGLGWHSPPTGSTTTGIPLDRTAIPATDRPRPGIESSGSGLRGYEQIIAPTGADRIGSDRPPDGTGSWIIDRTPFRDPSGPRVRREVAIGPGEVGDRGDIFIARTGRGRTHPVLVRHRKRAALWFSTSQSLSREERCRMRRTASSDRCQVGRASAKAAGILTRRRRARCVSFIVGVAEPDPADLPVVGQAFQPDTGPPGPSDRVRLESLTYDSGARPDTGPVSPIYRFVPSRFVPPSCPPQAARFGSVRGAARRAALRVVAGSDTMAVDVARAMGG